MKITLETKYGKYVIELQADPVQLCEVFDNLIVPVLLAAGFEKDSINNLLGDER